MDRAPAELAVRLSPSSPEVLRKAAESELVAKRYDNAQALSAESLSRAPFNARSLRVWGLSEASLGSEALADDVLTLAGNWSLRDDPAHGWLIGRRLRRGDYISSFAHADTIARRRPDAFPQMFNLFATAAQSDPRAVPALLGLLEKNPPWRAAFLDYLHADESRVGLLATIAIALDRTDGKLSRAELQQLYTAWANAGRLEGLKTIRRELGRPGTELLQNGDFQLDLDDQFYPFGWRVGSGPGVAPSVLEDDGAPENSALRVDYDGFGQTRVADQLTLLEPGRYRLNGRMKLETQQDDIRMRWTVICAETGAALVQERPVGQGDDETAWNPFSLDFIVPPANCSAQWIRLTPYPGDRRTSIVAWFDDIQLTRTAGGQSAARIEDAPKAPASR